MKKKISVVFLLSIAFCIVVVCEFVPGNSMNNDKIDMLDLTSTSDSRDKNVLSQQYDIESQNSPSSEASSSETASISKKPQTITPILDTTKYIDGRSINIGNKNYYSRYRDEYVCRNERLDTDRFFEFYYKEDGKEFRLDVPINVSYINRSFQGLPVSAYSNSILSDALIIETPFGKMLITVDMCNYERVEGVDSYNYYLFLDNGELLRLNNNLPNDEIAFHGTADFVSGEIFYLQSPPNAKSRLLCSVNLSNYICGELVSDVAEYALADNIFFTKYSATIPETISDEFRENVGVGLYEYDRNISSVREVLPSSECVVTNFIASEDYLFVNAYKCEGVEDSQHNRISILYNRELETFIECNGTYLFPAFTEEGILCSLNYDHSKQALISYDGEVTIWEN